MITEVVMNKVTKVIEQKIRPSLQEHQGDIELVEITADGYVKVQLTGACAACPGARQTLSGGGARRTASVLVRLTPGAANEPSPELTILSWNN